MQTARISTLALICFICTFNCYGQTAPVVRDLFHEPNDVIWVNSFEGMVNALHPVQIHLGFDGKIYRGYIELSDDLHIELEGQMQGEELVLSEIGEDGLISGHILGKLSEDRFNGNWWSASYDRTVQLSVLRTGLIELKKFEPRFVRVSGMRNDKIVEGNIFIETPSVVSGIWWLEDECYQLVGTCTDKLCKEIQLIDRSLDVNWQVSFTSERSIDLVDRQSKSTISVDGYYNLVGRQQLSYDVMADIRYPDIGHADFAAWVESVFTSWYRNISGEDKDKQLGPEQRWQLMASSWLDIYALEEDVVSGIITQYRNSDGGYQRHAFVYDLKESREVSLDELVKDEAYLKRVFAQYTPQGESKNYEYWLPTTHGVAMVTPFDIVDGESVIMIPYDEVRKALRKKGAAGKLID